MKRFKKMLRLLGLIVLLVLATVGIGIGGGVPVRSANRKENTIEITTDELENGEDKKEISQLDIKS